jgi:hypothetical protein
LLILKGIYWVWLAWFFLFWLYWVLRVVGIGNDINSNSISFVFNMKFYVFQLYSAFWIPVIFIAISVVKRKISVWEFGTIAITWGLMFFFLSHFHT